MVIKVEKLISKDDRKQIDEAWDRFDKALYGPGYTSEDEIYIKAYEDDKILGIISIEVEGGVTVIDEFIVLDEYRGKGVGQRLMDQTIELAKSKNCHKITLETDPRIRTVDFYKKVGFIEEGRIPNHYGKEETIILSKYL